MNTGQPTPPFVWAVFIPFMALVVIYNVVVLYMFAYLKRAHPTTWTELGSPSFLNNSIKNNFLFIGFMFRRKYYVLGDKRLNRLCLLIWILFGICMAMFLGFGALIHWMQS